MSTGQLRARGERPQRFSLDGCVLGATEHHGLCSYDTRRGCSCGVEPDPLERAASELDQAEERLRQASERFERSLSDKERALFERWRQRIARLARTEPPKGDSEIEQELEGLRLAMLGARPGARSCCWCRQLVTLDCDHDACAPASEETAREVGDTRRPPDIWEGEVFCAECLTRLPISVEPPPGLQSLDRLMTVARLRCTCGMQVSVSYSWKEGKVAGVRFERRIPHGVVLPYEPPIDSTNEVE